MKVWCMYVFVYMYVYLFVRALTNTIDVATVYLSQMFAYVFIVVVLY